MKTIHEPARDVPVIREADVVVLGGGPAGIGAAVSAARNGASTLLVERQGFLGGNLTMWLPLLGYLDVHGRQIIRGIPQELVERLAQRSAVTRHYPCALHQSYTIYDPEALKAIVLEMMQEARVGLLLHTFVADALVEKGRIEGVFVQNKSGRGAVVGRVYVDCTGDGDVAAWAGAPWEKGDQQGLMQPPTLMFTVRNVDVQRARQALVDHAERFKLQGIPADQVAGSPHVVAVGMMNFLERVNAVLHHQPADQVPFAPNDNLVPRGDFEREMRNRGMGLLCKSSVVRAEMPSVSIEHRPEGDTMVTLCPGSLVVGVTEMGTFGVTDDRTERVFKDGMRAVMDSIEQFGEPLAAARRAP